MEDWAARCAADHGQVNLIFNNAGVALSSTVEGGTMPTWNDRRHQLLGRGAWHQGIFAPPRPAATAMRINTSSVFGLFAQPGMSGYNARPPRRARLYRSPAPGARFATVRRLGHLCTPRWHSHRYLPQQPYRREHDWLLIHSEQQARADFEKLFITDADQAAKVIPQGGGKNKRRVLIGRDAYCLDSLAPAPAGGLSGLGSSPADAWRPNHAGRCLKTNDESRL